MLRRLEQTIRERDLIRRGQHIVVGCSGGADSIALLHGLWFLRDRFDFHLTAAHLHHGLRGKSADTDAQLVEEVCAFRGIPLITKRISVPAWRAKHGGSIEMAARAARHDFFRRVLEQTGADAVALAHHQNDQAETVLMRLLCGSGMNGLGGMDYRAAPSPGVTVIRPLLDVTRAHIELFLRRHRLAWRNDESNRETSILRNRIRLRLLPFIEAEGFPRAVPVLVRFAELMREENKLVEQQTKRLRVPSPSQPLSIRMLTSKPVAEQRRIIRAWLGDAMSSRRAIDFTLTENVRALALGNRQEPVHVGEGRQVLRGGDHLRIHAIAEGGASPAEKIPGVVLAVPGVTGLPGTDWQIRITRAVGFRPDNTTIGNVPSEVYLRRESGIKPTLTMRSRRPGDRIAPTGMAGSVSLKELMINHKVPESKRDAIPVLVSGSEVLWVPGYRVARTWALTGPKSPSWRVRIEQKSR